jgi:hypothetical protein
MGTPVEMAMTHNDVEMKPRSANCFFGLWAAILQTAALLSGCGVTEPPKSSISFPPELNQYPTDTQNPTLTLWNTVNSQLLLLRTNCPPDTEAGKARRAMIGDLYIDAIMQASTKDADPELVEWTVRVVESNKQFEYLAAFLDRVIANDNSATAGDTARATWVATRYSHEWLEGEAAVREAGQHLRQLLSERHARPFPPCAF